MKFGTSGRWVGARTGAGVTAIELSWLQPMDPWTEGQHIQILPLMSMKPWAVTKKKALH